MWVREADGGAPVPTGYSPHPRRGPLAGVPSSLTSPAKSLLLLQAQVSDGAFSSLKPSRLLLMESPAPSSAFQSCVIATSCSDFYCRVALTPSAHCGFQEDREEVVSAWSPDRLNGTAFSRGSPSPPRPGDPGVGGEGDMKITTAGHLAQVRTFAGGAPSDGGAVEARAHLRGLSAHRPC